MTVRNRTSLRSVAALADAGLIAGDDTAVLATIGAKYAVGISSTIADAIANEQAHGQVNGPLSRQFLPDVREGDTLPEEMGDPIGDELKSPVDGIVHRYPDRVLLKLATACPVYCRFCFRREHVGPGQPAMLSPSHLASALDYIRNDPNIWEVIVTGGDPLVLAPRHLQTVTAAIAEIEHVKVLRWHSRIPVVSPELINVERIEALKAAGTQTFVAIHCNHNDEFTEDADRAISDLRKAGMVLVSQTVLLRGVNNSVEALEALMRAFVERGILPYYLHHPDLAPGTAHFRLSISEGQALVAALRGRLSGVAQPTYVLDIPGAHGKVPIGPNYIDATHYGWRVRDPDGEEHSYSDPRSSKAD